MATGVRPLFDPQQGQPTLPLTREERWLSRTATLILLVGLSSIVLCAVIMYLGYTPTPFGDTWTQITGFSKTHSVPAWLWQEENEHRQPLEKLAIVVDIRWLHNRAILPLSLIFLTLIGHLVVWTIFLRKALDVPRYVQSALIGFFAFCLFSPSQWENLTWAFQWTCTAPFAFASASFVALVWFSNRGRGWTAIAIASVCAFAAETSLACGLFTWPVLSCAALFLPLRRLQRFCLWAISVAGIAVYMIGYRTPRGRPSPLLLLRHPGHVVKYAIRFLDQPLSHYFVQKGFVLWVLLAAVAVAAYYVVRNPATRLVGVVAIMTITYIVLTDGMIAMGRADYGIDQAGSSRYQSAVLLFWACGFCCISLALWYHGTRRQLLAWNIGALLLTIMPVSELGSLLNQVRGTAALRSLAGQAADMGVVDPDVPKDLAISPPEVTTGTAYLHSVGDLVGPEQKPAASLPAATPDQTACFGWLDEFLPEPGSAPGTRFFRASGWAVDTLTRRPVDEVAVVDSSGKILATTSVHLPRWDVLNANPGTSGLPGWRVYGHLTADPGQVHAIALVDGKSCALSGAKTLQ